QQPEGFGGGRAAVAEPGKVVDFTDVNFHGGFGPDAPELWPVRPGDYLELQGGGPMHRIEKVLTGSRLRVVQSSPTPPFPLAIPATSEYRITRAPRPMAGMP